MAETNWWEDAPLAGDAGDGSDASLPAVPAPVEPVEPAAPEANWWEDAPIAEPEPEVADTPEAHMKQVAPGVWIPNDRSMGDYFTGAAEVVGTVASSAIAEPISGLLGMGAAAIGGAQEGAETVESVQEAMTIQPETEVGKELMGDLGTFLQPVGEFFSGIESGAGEAVMDATGSPMLATIAHTAPTAMLEALGLGLLKRPSKAAEAAMDAQRRVKLDPKATRQEALQEMVQPEERSYTTITRDLKKGNAAQIAEDVLPDEAIKAAAEELGVDLNPSHYSTSEAYRRVEQAIKSQPGSKLAAREAEAIQALGERADELIVEAGGWTDKSILDPTVNTMMQGMIKDLGTQASKKYKAVREVVPLATKVRMRASEAYLGKRLEELGGDKTGLSSAEKQLLQVIEGDRPATYARLDQLRRDVGAGYKQQGVFKDDLTGNLDQVYKALSRDQQGIADAMGAGENFAAGRKLVATRKALEQQAMKVFGKEMNKSLLPKLNQSAGALTKGDVTHFQNLMEALPPAMRRPAAATMLNDLFTLGARQKGSLGQGFARAYDALERNKGAKAELFKYLPTEAQTRFDAIGKVSQGIFRAKALENTSRTARDVLQALEDGSMVTKVMTSPVGRTAATVATGGMGGMAVDAVAAAAKGQAKRAAKADDLLSSPSFTRAINTAMEGRVKEAEIMLQRTKAWQAFRNSVGEGTKAQIAMQGPIAWLTGSEERKQEELQQQQQQMMQQQQGQPGGQ